MLCDVFVTTPEEALGYEASVPLDRDARFNKYSPTELKGLTSLEFGTLWAILTDREWAANEHMLIDVAFGEGNETWLHRFQDEFVELLSRLDEKAINVASQAWSQTEELSCSPGDIRPVVETLVRLSHEAISKNEGLYMWGSL